MARIASQSCPLLTLTWARERDSYCNGQGERQWARQEPELEFREQCEKAAVVLQRCGRCARKASRDMTTTLLCLLVIPWCCTHQVTNTHHGNSPSASSLHSGWKRWITPTNGSRVGIPPVFFSLAGCKALSSPKRLSAAEILPAHQND